MLPRAHNHRNVGFGDHVLPSQKTHCLRIFAQDLVFQARLFPSFIVTPCSCTKFPSSAKTFSTQTKSNGATCTPFSFSTRITHCSSVLLKSCDRWCQVRSLRTIVSCAAVLYSHPLGAAAFDANGGAPCCLG